MKIREIQVLAEAEQDLESAKIFYENQEQGIGSYFWDSLLSDMRSLTIFGGVHSKSFGYYRMTAKRFPYSIYYDLKGDTIFVIAVLPERRNPDWLYKKLTKKH